MKNLSTIEEYFSHLRSSLAKAYKTAELAREKGFDPEESPEILLTEDIASRVEGIVGPPGISARIRELEKGRTREMLAFDIVKELVSGAHAANGAEKTIEQAVRTGLAILTEGVLVAPTEGIADIKIKSNPDGSSYLSLYFAGPIRSAGGTAAALSTVLADFARKHFGIADYRPTDTEVERYVEEINLYHVRAARLQYKPADDDVRAIVRNCPVCIDGDPTEEFEVSVYRALPRIETDRIRGGMCLVVAEGIAQKASKILKYTRALKLEWGWLEELVKVAKRDTGKAQISPNDHYLDDIAAGRPIFSYPSEKGSFRLRYGRTRMTGIAAKAIHPATMLVLDSFPVLGTQLKIERPGKGCVVSACDSIEGPIVRLKDGSVVQLNSPEEAKILNEIDRIIFLGDILVSLGDFTHTNHPLVPSGYCEEFWEQELRKADQNAKPPRPPSFDEALKLSQTLNIPLHPKFTYFWSDITPEELKSLAEWLATGKLNYDWFRLKELRVESTEAKRILENLGVPHRVHERFIIIEEHALPLLSSLGLLDGKSLSLKRFTPAFSNDKKPVEVISGLLGVKVRERAPVYIGARMGRPEKAEERPMKPPINALFPVGGYGKRLRSVTQAYKWAKERGEKIVVESARMLCPQCRTTTPTSKCPNCGSRTTLEFTCLKCGLKSDSEKCKKCGSRASPSDSLPLDIVSLLDNAIKRCANSLPADIKGVRGMTSKLKIPEPLEKGLLRAKHSVYVFKDGTCRVDATNMPMTHFYPSEIGVPLEKIKEMGYTHDAGGKELSSPDQLIELRPNDVIISENCRDYLFRVSKFMDDLLVYLYGLEPFYNLKEPSELAGHLLITLSPHTSCGVLSRLIGFTRAQVCFAHPYAISARRRNCDGDADSAFLLMDGLLNFSRKFLPESRGGTMDAPLILTSIINPKEVDDEVHAMDVCASYPLEFYEATLNFSNPGDARIEKVQDRLGKPEQYSGFGFTHSASPMDGIPTRTRYVELETMRDKVDAQFALSEKIRAVNTPDAAERLILNHFLPDLYGNLRSFSRQELRCIDCNSKYRRVPLSGKCNRCGSKLVLTVSKGGIEKYLELSKQLAEKYALPNYLKQRLLLLERDISSIFEDETKKQVSLEEFM